MEEIVIDKVTFGKKLKEHRLAQEKTQIQCALACNVCMETYQKWERGLSYPKPDRLEMICNYLEVEHD